MFDNIYRNKNILITGHTGFKGSWLTIWLKELGANIVGYSLDPPSVPSHFEATGLREKVTHIQGDIRDLDRVITTFKKYKPEFVFHLAAQPIVRLSYHDPKKTFDTNVGGTVNVLEAVRKTDSVRVLLNVTSDKCYENREWVWGYRENDPLGGYDPYSASKGCAELVFSAYLRSFFGSSARGGRPIGAGSCRAGNVIGGGDWGADRLVPDCIRALNAQKPIGIRNPGAIRPWQHVLEPLVGYLKLGAALWHDPQKYSGAWNFGPDENNHLSVIEMVARLIKQWGDGSWNDLSDRPAHHEASLLKLNCDKSHAELSWKSVLGLDECLPMTAGWYKKYYSEYQADIMYRFSLAQIHQYEEKVSA